MQPSCTARLMLWLDQSTMYGFQRNVCEVSFMTTSKESHAHPLHVWLICYKPWPASRVLNATSLRNAHLLLELRSPLLGGQEAGLLLLLRHVTRQAAQAGHAACQLRDVREAPGSCNAVGAPRPMGLLLGQAGAPDKPGKELCIQVGNLLLLARPGWQLLQVTFGKRIRFGLPHQDHHQLIVHGLLQRSISTCCIPCRSENKLGKLPADALDCKLCTSRSDPSAQTSALSLCLVMQQAHGTLHLKGSSA